MAIEYRSNAQSQKPPAKPKVEPDKPVAAALMKKIAEIETRNAPAPKKGVAQMQKVKKGRPKKGERTAKLVPITIMIQADLAERMKANKNMQEQARAALSAAFL